jgi:hypothetical protein
MAKAYQDYVGHENWKRQNEAREKGIPFEWCNITYEEFLKWYAANKDASERNRADAAATGGAGYEYYRDGVGWGRGKGRWTTWPDGSTAWEDEFGRKFNAPNPGRGGTAQKTAGTPNSSDSTRSRETSSNATEQYSSAQEKHEKPRRLLLRCVLAFFMISFSPIGILTLCWLVNAGRTPTETSAPERTIQNNMGQSQGATNPLNGESTVGAPEQTLPTHGHGPGTPTAAQLERWRYLDEYARTHSFSREAIEELNQGAGK